MKALQERYNLLRHLGSGGYGAVWEAQERSLFRDKQDSHVLRRVAIKQIRVFDGNLSTWTSEIQALARLSHPNIVQVYHYGIEPPYLAMELVNGIELSEKWPDFAPKEQIKMLSILAKIADAIAYAHEQGVIHGDLKPSNIIITKENTPKIIDFGLARIVGTENRSVAQGTPGFIAPEILQCTAADHRADIYSLGGLITQTMTGIPAFGTGADANILRRQLHEEFFLPKSLHKSLVSLISRCLSVDPDNRPSTAAIVAQELRRIAEEIDPTIEPFLSKTRIDLMKLRIVSLQFQYHPSFGDNILVHAIRSNNDPVRLRAISGRRNTPQRAAYDALSAAWNGAYVNIFNVRSHLHAPVYEIDGASLVILAPEQQISCREVAEVTGIYGGACAARTLVDRRSGRSKIKNQCSAVWVSRNTPFATLQEQITIHSARYGLRATVDLAVENAQTTIILHTTPANRQKNAISLRLAGLILDNQVAPNHSVVLALVCEEDTFFLRRSDHRREREIIAPRAAIIALNRWLAFFDTLPPKTSFGEVAQHCDEISCLSRRSTCAWQCQIAGRIGSYLNLDPIPLMTHALSPKMTQKLRKYVIHQTQTLARQAWNAKGEKQEVERICAATTQLWSFVENATTDELKAELETNELQQTA